MAGIIIWSKVLVKNTNIGGVLKQAFVQIHHLMN